MTGDNNQLNIYSASTLVGNLILQKDQIFLQYAPDWKQSGFAISPHLPISENIPTTNVQRYLRNLLPEGDVLETLLTNLRLSNGNTFGLLRALGIDTSGAFIFLPANHTLPSKSSFRAITPSELKKRLDTRDKYSLIIWDKKPRLSMAGVQDKINVMINSKDEMGFGEGKLISTHLLKFEKQKLLHLVLNEYTTMRLAKACGLEVAEVELMRYGKYPALLIKRFDRKFVTNKEVMRRHVIDGCQALNLPPDYKYERNFGSGRDVMHIREGASLIKLFEFAKLCINPAETKRKILNWVLFNLLTYNYDAHGKNISFFVGKNGITLTPFYDLLNIKMYDQFDNELAMALGDHFDGETIMAYQLANFADSCQLKRSYLVRQLQNMSSQLLSALKSDEIFNIADNDAETNYLKKYRRMLTKRCKHLFAQADLVTSIEL